MGLPLGAAIAMTGPHGFFVLDAAHTGDVVFGATGTGIAAVMPMLGELGRTPPGAGHRRMIFWGVRHESDLFARAGDRGPGGPGRRRAEPLSDRPRTGLDRRSRPNHGRGARAAPQPCHADVLSGR